MEAKSPLLIGWAQTDITPPRSVMLRGQFHVRISEGVLDPLTATALVLETASGGVTVLVSCDLILISDELRDGVRAALAGRIPGLDPARVCLNATHTHTGPELAPMDGVPGIPPELSDRLDVMAPQQYVELAVERIVDAVVDAWTNRQPSGISWGLTQAVVSHNRRWTSYAGVATMYGNVNTPEFHHVEGWEDHSLGILCTWSADKELTGLVVNVPCPAQVSEQDYRISADFWHETRDLLRRRLGADLHVLAQCSPAGDLSPHHIVRKAEAERRLRLKGQTRRDEIAETIADAVVPMVQLLRDEIDWHPHLEHRVATLALPCRRVSHDDVVSTLAEAEPWRKRYEELLQVVAEDPSLLERPRWYVEITETFRRVRWYENVRTAAENQATTFPAEVHVVRLGDVVFATNPFELFVDFGLQIQVQSPAAQTFLVQLAGTGRYLPSARAVAGGGYGAVAASTPIGPDGGLELVRGTVEMMKALW